MVTQHRAVEIAKLEKLIHHKRNDEHDSAKLDGVFCFAKAFLLTLPLQFPDAGMSFAYDGSLGFVWESNGTFLYIDLLLDETAIFYYRLSNGCTGSGSLPYDIARLQQAINNVTYELRVSWLEADQNDREMRDR